MARMTSVEPLRTSVEAQLELPGRRVELLDISWRSPLDITVVEDDPVLEMSLIPVVPDVAARFEADGPAERFSGMGTVFFKPHGVPLHVRCPVGDAYSLRCILSRERFEELHPARDGWQPSQLQACLDIQTPLIRTVLNHLAREARAPGFASAIFLDTWTTGIMVELIRHLRRLPADGEPRTGGLAPWQLRRVRDYIAACDDAVPALEDIAKHIEVSKRHLTRAFKQSTGQTIGAYVQDIQVDRAKTLLAETNLPIKEISARLGFTHARNFSMAFTRAALQSPNAFRRDNRRRRLLA